MERLYAGWRMQYVKRAESIQKKRGCLFCLLRRAGDDEERLVLERGKNAYLLLNAYPYNSGHLMVALHRHVGKLGKLTTAERRELWDLVSLGELLLDRVYHPDGINVGINLGRSAGAGVDGHVHVHLVPRWQGDTNFMTTVAGAKVLPEELPESYRRLSEALRRLRTAGKKPRR